jgi:hypothetical protein
MEVNSRRDSFSMQPSQGVPSQESLEKGTFDQQELTIQFLHRKPHHLAGSGPRVSKWILQALDRLVYDTPQVMLNGVSQFRVGFDPGPPAVVCRHIVALGLRKLIIQWSQEGFFLDTAQSIFTKQEIDDTVKNMTVRQGDDLYHRFTGNALRVDFCDGDQFRKVVDDHFRKMHSTDLAPAWKLLIITSDGRGRPGPEVVGHGMYAVLLKDGKKCSIFFCDPNFNKWKYAKAQPVSSKNRADSQVTATQDDPWLVSQFFISKDINYGDRNNGILVYEVDPGPAWIDLRKDLYEPAGDILCEIDTLMKCQAMLGTVSLSKSADENQWRQLGGTLNRALSGDGGQAEFDSAVYVVKEISREQPVETYYKFFSEVKIGNALDAAANKNLEVKGAQPFRILEDLFTTQDPHSLVAALKANTDENIVIEVLRKFYALHCSFELDKNGTPALAKLVKFFENVEAMTVDEKNMLNAVFYKKAHIGSKFEQSINLGIRGGFFVEHPHLLKAACKSLEFLRELNPYLSDIKVLVGTCLVLILMSKRQNDEKAAVAYEDVVAMLDREGLFKDSHELAELLARLRSNRLNLMFRSISSGTYKPGALRELITTLSSLDLKPEFRLTTEEFADKMHELEAILKEAGIVGSEACNILAETKSAAIAFLSLGITQPMQILMNAVMRVEPGIENPEMLSELKDRIVDTGTDLIKQRRQKMIPLEANSRD